MSWSLGSVKYAHVGYPKYIFYVKDICRNRHILQTNEQKKYTSLKKNWAELGYKSDLCK